MKKIYRQEVLNGLGVTDENSHDVLTEPDLVSLPGPVQRYIRLTGSVGKEKVRNVWVRGNGRIRSKPDSGWMNFESEQYNFFHSPLRIFYISARKLGIPVRGLHLYKNVTASMVIKLAGIFKIVDARGPEMNQAETVTLLNDMCFIAPASLTDPRISWENAGDNRVKARFTNGNITVAADLEFDDEGRLVNFISYDRFETTDGKSYRNYPWITPVKEYEHFGDYYLPSKADVIYRYPNGDFCYLEFSLQKIRYNI